MGAAAARFPKINEDPASPYWQEVKANRERLLEYMITGDFGKQFIYLTSIENIHMQRRGGQVSEANLETAARCLATTPAGGATHRLATREEIEQFKAAQETRTAEIHAIDESRKSTTVLKVQMSPSGDGQTMELKPVSDKPNKR